jgi:hypothetical protein
VEDPSPSETETGGAEIGFEGENGDPRQRSSTRWTKLQPWTTTRPWIASQRLGFFPQQWVTELLFFLSDA